MDQINISFEILIKFCKSSQYKSNLINEFEICLDKEFTKLYELIKLASTNNGQVEITEQFFNEKFFPDIQQINLIYNGDFEQDFKWWNINNIHLQKSKLKFLIKACELYSDYMTEEFESDQPCSTHYFLPSTKFVGLWESLYFDEDLKNKLLNYIQTLAFFATCNVNNTLINFNKILLLYGPPGTGKTSLCKALCQKASILLSDSYQQFQLIEINAHSLFSKWFSESGKLIIKIFNNIREYAENKDTLIFVLVDEVESLVYDRERINSSDPSDAIRVVNALLTQLDSIKPLDNVIVLANSNITKVIDNAFIDRADIKEFVGYPSISSIFQIYISSIQELINSKLIIDNNNTTNVSMKYSDKLSEPSIKNKLLSISTLSQNFAGRTLRKLPFLAIALYCKDKRKITLTDFLNALEMAVEKQIDTSKNFNKNK